MEHREYPFYLAGEPCLPNRDLEVFNKYTGKVAARVAVPDAGDIEHAFMRAHEGRGAMAGLYTYQRRDMLLGLAEGVTGRSAEFAQALVMETGKPITVARVEVERCVQTLCDSAEQVSQVQGCVQPLDVSSKSEGFEGIIKRFAVGVCSLITPSNFPLNLLAHKVGPAIAAGCPFVLKPDPRTPITSLMFAALLCEQGLPAGSWSVLSAVREGLNLFSEDEHIALLSFTGSGVVGWKLKKCVNRAKVLLELGGNAACIVDERTNIDYAAGRIVLGAYLQSGQSCISVQRVLVHRSLYDDLVARLIDRIGSLPMGDPMDEATVIGPMIDKSETDRVSAWVHGAVQAGAKVLIGGRQDGVFYEPTLMTDVPGDVPLGCEEVFGPVAMVQPFDDFDAALDVVNTSRFGLQAGVFTRDLSRAHRAFEKLEVGGVVINDVPSSRIDAMPYGGIKDSGIGREGPAYVIQEMTEPRLMLINHNAP